ncbi:S-layer homology domain-containing protein [Metasolibacillus meyeri]|uniref:S-layer homology domain-containing protein n=1 Tax=Metasolibacillus meyeri TaxID=1071052 RepID=UPI000D309396|nr:S-layer homology domain-containing protein [Metasolibacillus meyeri]
MIKKITTLVIAIILMLTVVMPSSSYANDIKGHQMVNELTHWADLGVILPDSKGNYNPNRAVTRGEFAAYITRAFNLPASDKYQFSDLKVGDPLTFEIQAAAGSGILGGYPDGTFRPHEKITRQHMAAMLYKALRYLNVPLNSAPLTFNDNHKISKQFHEAVATSVYYNIIRGSHEKKGVFFNPQGSATIAHAAAFLYRTHVVTQQYGQAEPENNTPQPTPPPVETNNNSYYVGAISGSNITKQPTVYVTYEQAEAAYQVANSINLLFQGDKIIKMNSGIASAADVAANTVTIYGNKDFTNALTYVVEGSELKYFGSNDKYAIVQAGDTKGYAKLSEITLTPTSLIKGRDYYYVANGMLSHKLYDHIKQAFIGEYVMGEAPSFMAAGVHYYGTDGVHFYNANDQLVGQHYQYFQFASLRQPTNYTAEELDYMIHTILEERRTLAPRYANILTESRLLGLGQFLKTMEQEHRVNALFILATAIHESDYGMSTHALQKNNIFGIRVFDANEAAGSTYATPNDSVLAFINQYVNKNYAPQSGGYAKGAVPGNKTTGMNVHYASDPFWGSKIAGHMYRLDIRFGRKDHKQGRLAMVLNNGEPVNARMEPSTSSPIAFTYKAKVIGESGLFGYPVAIVEETIGSDGYIWYKVYSDNNPPANFVWIRSDLVKPL